MARQETTAEREEDHRQDHRQEEQHIGREVRQLWQAEEPGCDDQREERRHRVEGEVADRTTYEEAHHADVVPTDVLHGCAQPTTLTLRTRHHRDADEERLLDDEHQHPRQEEALEAPLRVVGYDPFALDGADGDTCGFAGGTVVALRFDFAPHRQRYLGRRQREGLVVECGDEGRMQVDVRLAPAHQHTVEVLGDNQDAVGTLLPDEAVGL